MGFDTDQATVYQIRPQHRNEEVREIIPGDYAGVMITDRGKSYEADEFKRVDQQKCMSHVLRNIAEVVETKKGRAQDFGVKAEMLFQDGMQLWRQRDSLAADDFAGQAGQIKELVSDHLRDRTLTDADNQRLLDGLGWHDDRGSLMRFLDAPFVEPTNNRAEHSSPGGDCQEGVPLFQNPGRSQCLRRIRQHRADGDQEWCGFGGFGVLRFIHGAERRAE